MELVTRYRIEKDRKDEQVLKDWERMTSVPGAMRTMVIGKLMRKYNIHSRSGVYACINRATKRRAENG